VLFLLQLSVDQLLVDTVLIKEFLVSALLNNFTILQADNLIGILDGSESMRDHDNSFTAFFAQLVDGQLYLVLTLCVKG